MEITTIGVDLAKSVFQVHGVDRHGKTVLRKQFRRDHVANFMANLPPCLVGWKLVAARITGRASCSASGTPSGSCRRSS